MTVLDLLPGQLPAGGRMRLLVPVGLQIKHRMQVYRNKNCFK